ncbi:TPA: hypothetical protein N0F65_011779 [Lagenidium giganteum]|uniref:Nitroreductase domain-containing protein n=1 Tax=Lagenidium giganteum TaxID=4803 RepID=A0AAV2YHY0_9STRA|nr:TPA: hypothetical protein N0F65_011779 [Lagenidium giganteum]
MLMMMMRGAGRVCGGPVQAATARRWTHSDAELQTLRHVLAKRTSARGWASKPVPEHVLGDVLRLTLRAPSGFNMQPYACILVRTPEDRERIAVSMLAGNAARVKQAPVVAVFAADLEPSKRVPHIQQMMYKNDFPADAINNLPLYVRMFAGEGHLATGVRSVVSTLMSPLRAVPSSTPTIAWSYKQTAIAATTFMFAAQAHGLVTRPMEGFDELRLRYALDIPERYSIPMVVCCGYPEHQETADTASTSSAKPTPRLEPSDLFFDGRFGSPSDAFFKSE